MSFFKDFKDDLSLAVDELLPGEDLELDDSSEMMVNTLEGDLDIESELSKLDGLLERVDSKEPVKHVQIEPEEPVLEKVTEPKPQKRPAVMPRPTAAPRQQAAPKEQPKAEPRKRPEKEASIQAALSRFDTILEPEKDDDDLPFDFDALLKEAEEKPRRVQQPRPQPRTQPQQQRMQPQQQRTQPRPPQRTQQPQPKPVAEPKAQSAFYENRKPSTTMKEEIPMNEELVNETSTMAMGEELSTESMEITDEVSIITTGTTIKGNLSTTGSFSISGRVEGNVQCNGKLEVTGTIKGNSSSSEVFSDAAKIEGEIMSTGTVKIGLGSVVVGNISATSAVIAGAVKGDIDVQGPVVVDTSAVIVGNIKSRSVQINNGAVIEGFCSQCYADIDVESLFGEAKKGK